ncbi:MAG TPA: family 20 glycosylhydrolase [Verrucomicrobiae bacterium]
MAVCAWASAARAEESLDQLMPVRGFCISAPRPSEVDRFVKFIGQELAPRGVNTLILRVDYDYQFKSHPELSEGGALSLEDVKKMVAECRKDHIHLIPQINCLGHQSFGKTLGSLLKQYPEFDETPWVKMPEHYKWPNADRLYCKSYCPLHPKVHEVLFGVIDEICDAFETDAFHAGMDEVFYIGESKCPRCGGKDKAELFAGEVTTLRDHLQSKGRHLWIWCDRLLDAKASGLGEWEASANGTARAVDLIPKDVMLCDWHYENDVPTAPYLAMKGFHVVTCPWKSSKLAVWQADDMANWRQRSPRELKDKFAGVMQTVWTGAGRFLGSDYTSEPGATNSWNCFTAMFDEIQKLQSAAK